MKVIEVTHPIREDQFIQEDVAMAFGFFDGMHRGHDQVFQALDESACWTVEESSHDLRPSSVCCT